MPKQRKWLTVGIVCVGLIAAPIVYFISHLLRGSLDAEDFYRSRPILSAMRASRQGASPNVAAARLTLLQRIPLGTAKSAAIDVLTSEGFDCIAAKWPADAAARKHDGYADEDLKARLVDCQLLAPAEMGYTRWTVDVWFDDANLLRGARVSISDIGL